MNSQFHLLIFRHSYRHGFHYISLLLHKEIYQRVENLKQISARASAKMTFRKIALSTNFPLSKTQSDLDISTITSLLYCSRRAWKMFDIQSYPGNPPNPYMFRVYHCLWIYWCSKQAFHYWEICFHRYHTRITANGL